MAGVRIIGVSKRSLTGRIVNTCAGLVEFESSLERDALLVFDFDRSVTEVQEQPLTIQFRGSRGEARRYTPDFYVTYVDCARPPLLVEVKYREDLWRHWSSLKPRLRAGVRHARSQGWRFRIMSEVEIRRGYSVPNIRFLRGYRNLLPQPGYEEQLMGVLEENKVMTVNRVLDTVCHTQNARAHMIPALWRLVCVGAVGTDLREPLTMNSSVWPLGED